MLMAVEVLSVDKKKLQSFTGNGGVSKWLKNSLIGAKNSKQTIDICTFHILFNNL